MERDDNMSAAKHLSQVMSTAKVIPFDETSKFIIMSDCHRGEGNWGDNFSSNQNLYFTALSYYNKRSFTYIELGDGDELWENRRMKNIIIQVALILFFTTHIIAQANLQDDYPAIIPVYLFLLYVILRYWF